MARQAGKFGPYAAGELSPTPAPLSALALRTRRLLGGLSGAELVRSRIALEVRLAGLAPGDRLPDAGVISDSLGVGEITVRRALETMCQDGLLERRRGRAGGTFIAQRWQAVTGALHDPAQATPLLEFQVVLECGLVARACGDVSEADLEALWQDVHDMDLAGDPSAFAVADAHFHLDLALVLGGPLARDRLADLLGPLSLLLPEPSIATARRQNRCHAELLDGLQAGLLEPAIRAVKQHATAGEG